VVIKKQQAVSLRSAILFRGAFTFMRKAFLFKYRAATWLVGSLENQATNKPGYSAHRLHT
jgi:hypothetical protein